MVTKKATAKKTTTKKVKAKRKPNAAFMRPMTPSPVLGAVIGASALPRTQAVKKIWVYIKKNNLQDKVNRRQINADDKLKALFGGKKSATMFELAKYLGKHLS
ncbi:MAG: SWIB/MDM2 domain-containing protein [Pseudomonadota bacterium]